MDDNKTNNKEINEIVGRRNLSKISSVEKSTSASKTEISQILENNLYWYNREVVKSDEECAERLNEFFARLQERGEIPTVEKMCLALGTTRHRVWEWEKGRNLNRSNLIKKAKEILAALDAELVSKGKIPQITYIFRAKNYFGLKDVQEITIEPKNPMGDLSDPEQVKQRYIESITAGGEKSDV